MITLLKVIVSYLAAGVTAAVLACFAATQFTLAGLSNFGMDVSIADRISATVHDVIGMGPPYMAVIGVGFLIAFAFTALLLRWAPGSRGLWFSVSGAVAIVAAILIIKYFLGGTIIGAARSPLGLACQGLAGAAGGWLFAQILPRRNLT